MRTRVPLLMLALASCSSKSPAPTTPTGEDVTPPPGAGDTSAPPVAAAGDRPRFSEFEVRDGGALALPGAISFVANGDTLDEAASLQALWYAHDYLEQKPYVTLVRLEGHGTEAGNDAMVMTGERALAVGRWLAAHGIDCKRMLVAAFGNTKPIADPRSAERTKNERIEIVNAELRGRAIGGMPTDGGAAAAAPVCDE